MKSYIIKENLKYHHIDEKKFNSNIICIVLRKKMNGNNNLCNELIIAMLKRGSSRKYDKKKIEIEMENINSIDLEIKRMRIGTEEVWKFYLKFINLGSDKGNENISRVVKFLYEIIFNMDINNNSLNEKKIVYEKNRLANNLEEDKEKIRKKITYMFHNKNKTENIDRKGIFSIKDSEVIIRYKEMIEKSKKDFFYIGSYPNIKMLEVIFKEFTSKVENQIEEKKNKPTNKKKIDINKPNKIEIMKEIKNKKKEIKKEYNYVFISLRNNEKVYEEEVEVLCLVIKNILNLELVKKKVGKEIKSSVLNKTEGILIQGMCRTERTEEFKMKIENILKEKEKYLTKKIIDSEKKRMIKKYFLIMDNQKKLLDFYISNGFYGNEVAIENIFDKIEKVEHKSLMITSKKFTIETICTLEEEVTIQ